MQKSNNGWIVGLCVVGGLVAAAVTTGILGWNWYQGGLKPVGCESSEADGVCESVAVTVSAGDSSAMIADKLEEKGLIKSAKVFKIFVKLSGKGGDMKAGEHKVNKGMSVEEIIDKLSEDPVVETFRVTFLPGGTLAEAKKTLMTLGYGAEEIDAAFTKNYEHEALAGKPKKADLEGYLYGETYEFYAGVPVETIVLRCLDELNKVVVDNGLVEKYRLQGLSLYEGITMASIVQRESLGAYKDMQQIAQVFLLRMKVGMNLGSDVTYQYIADKLGLERDPSLDNKYNTRVYPGLPPGPISAPGANALKAVGNPAKGDYLFFLSGDDDKTYFGRTEYEHQQNIVNHCQQKCLIL